MKYLKDNDAPSEIILTHCKVSISINFHTYFLVSTNLILTEQTIFPIFRWEHLIYQLAGHDHVIEYVIKKGQVVVERSKSVLV